MTLEFINILFRSTLFAGAGSFVLICLFSGIIQGCAFLLGLGWGCLNLFFIKHLTQNILLSKQRNFLKIGFLLTVKFPILYFFGYLLLKSAYFSSFHVVLGLSLFFVIIFLKGIDKTLLQNAL